MVKSDGKTDGKSDGKTDGKMDVIFVFSDPENPKPQFI